MRKPKSTIMREKYRIIEIRNISTTIVELFTEEMTAKHWNDLQEESEKKNTENYLIAASLDEWDDMLELHVQKSHLLFKAGVLEEPKL